MGGSFQLRRQQDIVAQMIGYLMGHTPYITDYSSGSIVRSLCESIAEEMYSHNVAFAEGISEAITTSVKQAFNFPLQQPQNATGEIVFYRQMLASPTVLYSNVSTGLTSGVAAPISGSLYNTQDGSNTGSVFGKLVGGSSLYYGISGAKKRSNTSYETASTASNLSVPATSNGSTITHGRISELKWEKLNIYDEYTVYRSSVDPSLLSLSIPIPTDTLSSDILGTSTAIDIASGSSGLFGEYFFSVSAKDTSELVSTGSKPFPLILVNQTGNISSLAIPNANGYRFYRSVIARPIASTFSLSAASGGSLSASNYYYKIAGVKNSTYLGPVTDAKTVAVTSGQPSVNISFGLVSDASTYRIYRYTTLLPPVKSFLINLDSGGNGVYASAFIRPVLATPTSAASATGLPAGTWTYRVAPIFSSTDFGQIIGISSNSISITNTSNQTFTIAWSWGTSFVKYNASNAPITPITKVRVYRKVTNALVSSFTGSISGTTLTVTAAPTSPIAIGQTLSSTATGTNVLSGTKITSQKPLNESGFSGEVSGGIGRYTVSSSQSSSQTVTSRPMTATVSSSQWAYKDIDSATVATTSFADLNNTGEWTADQYVNDAAFPSSPMITYNDTGSLGEDIAWPYDNYPMQNSYYVDSSTNVVFWTDSVVQQNSIVWPYVHKINNFSTTVSAATLIASKATILEATNPAKTLYVSVDTGEVPIVAADYYATWPTINNAQSVEGALSIPAGTRVSVPGTYKIYETLSTTLMPIDSSSQTATASCVSAGIIGNTAIGSVTNIDTNVYGIAAVTNLKAFTNGKNLETEQEWRVRFQKNIKQLARGTLDSLEEGAKQAYIADANGIVTEQITKSFAYQESASSTAVYVANQSGYAPSSEILSETEKILTGYTTSDGVRYPGYKPAGIPITVRSAVFSPVDITVNATLSTGYKISTLSTAIEKTVESYIMSLDISDGFAVPVLSQSVLSVATITSGSYSSSTLTVTEKSGTLYIGQQLTGTGVPSNTVISNIISSPGSLPSVSNPWTYTVSKSLASGTTVIPTTTFPITASVTSLFSSAAGIPLYQTDGFAQYQVVLVNVNGQKSIPSNTLQISNVPYNYNYIPIQWTVPAGSSSALLNAEVLRWNVGTATWKLLATVSGTTTSFIDTNISAQNDYSFTTSTRTVFQKSALVQKLMRIPGIVAVKVYASYDSADNEVIVPNVGSIISLGSLTVR